MVLALFFCSGATALVYEVIWSKFLAQMFGSTIYAQTVVLAAFMAGLALGNRLFGGWADRLPNPVRGYGLLELAIGIYAALFPALDRAADHIFVSVGSAMAGRAGLLLGLKGALSAALLLGPTTLMGGTLPLLAAWLQKSSSDDAGRRSARFYSVNSLGAVVGAGLAGFCLVQTFGMVGALRVTALVNVTVGIAAIVIDRTDAHADRQVGPAKSGQSAEPGGVRIAAQRFAGMLVALTGGVSMGLEVLASRSLALIFGSSLQTFAVVLMAFILGIGLGSAWIASPRRARFGEKLVVLLLCSAAAWITSLVFNIERWVDLYRIAHIGLARTGVGYFYHQLLATGMSLVLLGVPAALIGAVLPLMIRRVSSDGGALLGAEVGTLLTWNTLGAVAGVLLTGFVLMPQAGLRNAFGVLALLLAVAALLIAARRRRAAGFAGAACVCVFAGSLFAFGNEGWRHVMGTGIFRLRETQFDPNFMSQLKQHIKILFYEDAPDATVSVEQVDGVIGPQNIGLRINGKPDAGTSLNLITQFLLAHLPLMAKPDAKDVFVLGLGSGMTAAAVLSYPVENLVVAENCEPVIRAAKNCFADWNRHVLDDPRTHVWAEDGRTVLKIRPQLYDVIISEPSNPWSVGVGSVFSRECYQIEAGRLKPGGIMAQWFHVYEMNDRIVSLVLRTFGSVFRYVEIWDSGAGDIIMLGSLQPWPTGPEVFRKGFAIERARTDMWMIDVPSPEALLAKQLASQRTGFAIAGFGPIQSDLFPILEYAAPKTFYLNTESRMLNLYDERTHQQLLAPLEKRRILGSLSLADIQVLFGMFSSVNGELQGCLSGAPSFADVPCVFNKPTPAPASGSSETDLDRAAAAFAAGNLETAERLAAAASIQNPDDPQAGYLRRVIERSKGQERE